MPLKSNCNHIVFIMEGKQKKNTFRFENTSLRFTIVEHIVLRIIQVYSKIIIWMNCQMSTEPLPISLRTI